MATPMTPAQWQAALERWDVPVRYFPGWETRTRPGPFNPHGVVIHHTGSDAGQDEAYNHFLFVTGRPAEGIPGPLCQGTVEMDGDFWLGATGRANHAGAGSATTRSHVISEDYSGYTRELSPGWDSADGNADYYGFEVKFDGGQPMTAAQYRTTVLTVCAVLEHHGWSGLSVIGHREHTRRKIDPGSTPMDQFRRDVRDQLQAGPPGGGKDTVLIRATTANIMSNPVMSQDRVVHDVQTIAKGRDLIGWQEIAYPLYAEAIKALDGFDHYLPTFHDGTPMEIPISWQTDRWEKIDEGFTLAHRGRAKVSPDRYITWVILRHKRAGVTVARVNTHLISGAWGGWKPTRSWRRKQWAVHIAQLTKVVNRLSSHGHIVIVGGDFNRDSYKVLGNAVAYDVEWSARTHGKELLDYLLHIPDDRLTALGGVVIGGLFTDHQAVVVRYHLRKAGA